jgi:hypothetical protein
MDTIPSIVLNKIYWYLWRYTQNELCKEYHRRITYQNDIMRLSTDNKNKLTYYNHFNYREWHYWNMSVYIYIHRAFFDTNVVKLPKNYFYIPLEKKT